MHKVISVAENVVYKCVRYPMSSLEYNKTEDFKYMKYHLQIYGSERFSTLIMKSSTIPPNYLQRSVRALYENNKSLLLQLTETDTFLTDMHTLS